MKLNTTKFSIGSDPEVFLKKVIDGIPEYFPAVAVITGDKYDPTPVGDKGRNILVDNVMLEFNSIPTLNMKDFVNEHVTFLDYLRGEMSKKQCTISTKAFVEFHPRFLNNKSAKTFGCEPDFNAYTLSENPVPKAEVNYRTAAGHIHIGYDNPSKKKSVELIKLLDLILGVESVLLDQDRHRRVMYGKAGAYRKKPFGFEYRVLSNYWIFNEDYLRKVYKGVQRAFKLFNAGFEMDRNMEHKVINTINKYDTKSALEINNEIKKINI